MKLLTNVVERINCQADLKYIVNRPHLVICDRLYLGLMDASCNRL